MRNLITYFIKYPVAGKVLIFGMLVLGILGILNLNSSFFPLNESRNILINVTYPGASPQEMEEGVVLKIEDNLRGLVGVDRFTSTSSENTATINVEVLKGYDVDVVLADIKNAVDKVPSFPVGMEPPVISKGIFRTEAVSMVVSGKDVSLKSLKDIARTVETDLRTIDGISQVSVTGYPAEEIEIAVDENKLRAYNLTFREVANAVAQTNILVTGGSIKTKDEEYLIRVRNRAYYGDDLEQIVVKADDSGNQIRLHDVSTIRDRWSENPDRSYFDGQPSVRIEVSTTNSEDLISVAEKTKNYITTFNETHNNVHLDITRDASSVVVERTKLLLRNGIQGMFLVILFLALFLKPRLALWVAFGIPMSFIGMFIFAGMLGVTINVLSLFGMIIVIGILVDDGIVIAENIYDQYLNGKSRIRAAIDGTMEVLPAVGSGVITTLVAFSTFFFLEGRIGEFFGEVSTIVILTLSISLVEATLLLPSHIAHSKALTKKQKTYWFNQKADQFISWSRDRLYIPYLKFFIKHKFLGLMIPISMMTITLGALSGGIIRTTFFPNVASDRVVVTLKMPQGTSEGITDSLIQRIEDATWRVNKIYSKKQHGGLDVVQNVIRRIGPGTANATLTINLLPGEKRDFPSFAIATAINKEVGPLYGIESIEFGSGSNFGGKPISVALMSSNIEQLKEAKQMLKTEFMKNPLLKDISDNDPQGIKEIKLTLKDDAYSMGFQLADVINQVRSGFFGLQVQRFQRGRDEIKVWVRYDRQERSSIKNLDDMRVVSTTGQRVPLNEIAKYSIVRGETSINHLNGKREIQIDADLKDPNNSATDIMASLKKEFLPVITSKYPSVTASFEGQNREASKVTKSAGRVLPVIILIIYIIIAFTFRSMSQPLILLFMVPFSLIGVAWGHYIHDYSINILSFLGIIALIGIVVNDGLVLISKFNLYLKEGLKFNDALIAAGRSRYRAIFLTSLTTVAGLAPLIFETSRQAKFLIPMAISIAYGIMLSTLLTLIMLPILLAMANSTKVYWTWLISGRKPEREELERAIIELNDEKFETVA